MSEEHISIQALYDYKFDKKMTYISGGTRFQFKHCTIIRCMKAADGTIVNGISIQALYDYK